MSPAELHALSEDADGHDARPAPAHWGVTHREAPESLRTAHVSAVDHASQLRHAARLARRHHAND